MLINWRHHKPSVPGYYFLKLRDRQPLFVRLGENGVVTHPHTGLLVCFGDAPFQDRRDAQWSEILLFPPGLKPKPSNYGPKQHGEREYNARGDQLTDKGMIEFSP